MSATDLQQLRQPYGLDQPAVRWLTGMFRGDFGNLLREPSAVPALMGERLPVEPAQSGLAALFADIELRPSSCSF